MGLSTSQPGWLRVYHYLLDDEAHALESFLVGAILPYGVVVDLVHSIDEAYLEIKQRLQIHVYKIVTHPYQVVDGGLGVASSHLLEKPIIRHQQQWTSSFGWGVLVLIRLALLARMDFIVHGVLAFLVLQFEALLDVTTCLGSDTRLILVHLYIGGLVGHHSVLFGLWQVSPRRLYMVGFIRKVDGHGHCPILNVSPH